LAILHVHVDNGGDVVFVGHFEEWTQSLHVVDVAVAADMVQPIL
jgi:hypothetical protein